MVNSVPYYAKPNTKPITDGPRDEDEDRRAADGKRFDDIDRLDEVDPEQEIDHNLRKTKCNQGRPQQVPASKHRRKHETRFIRIDGGMPTLIMFRSRAQLTPYLAARFDLRQPSP